MKDAPCIHVRVSRLIYAPPGGRWACDECGAQFHPVELRCIMPSAVEGQALAEHYRDAMAAKRELTPDDEDAITGLLTRDIPPGTCPDCTPEARCDAHWCCAGCDRSLPPGGVDDV